MLKGCYRHPATFRLTNPGCTLTPVTMNSDFESVFQLKLEVRNVRRPVWRRFQVPSTQTFWDLHCAIQNLLKFDLDTNFVFHVHTAEGHLKTFAIDEEIGYFAPNPQAAWLFRIADPRKSLRDRHPSICALQGPPRWRTL